MLNIDWFEPFNGCVYAVGVLYLVVMNLSRSQRYRRQKIVISGIIPALNEPPLTINSYLSPMVTELLQLWQGVPSVKVVKLWCVQHYLLLHVTCRLDGRSVDFLVIQLTLDVLAVTVHFLKVDYSVIIRVMIEILGKCEAINNIDRMFQD